MNQLSFYAQNLRHKTCFTNEMCKTLLGYRINSVYKKIFYFVLIGKGSVFQFPLKMTTDWLSTETRIVEYVDPSTKSYGEVSAFRS